MSKGIEQQELERQVRELNKKMASLELQLAEVNRDKKEIRHRILLLNNQPSVSDHALIRYLERKLGKKFEEYREEILCPQVIQALEDGLSEIEVEGVRFRLAGKTVVTVIC